ncbi:MAG: UbiA family prenyltransferase [Verrucomicrobia bacterium]|nr:UbiA family prenyltransferase [Verrucomicrobiota bacterium]
MKNEKNDPFRTLGALLILGRVSNLPTVWSNCVAAWLIAGGDFNWELLQICIGATLLYTGGMFLNDAFDSGFDRQHRRERPIPSGAIPVATVWFWGFFWLGSGVALISSQGKTPAVIVVILALSIILYDAVHKAITFSPVLMAACRFWLYLSVASAAPHGITGLVIWSALALSAYIVGLSYIARKESVHGPLKYWPCSFLVVPVVLASLVNAGGNLTQAIVYSGLLAAWMLYCLRHAFWAPQRNIGRTVSGLLAGIVIVDWLAVAVEPLQVGLLFALFFGMALVFQRFIPAT